MHTLDEKVNWQYDAESIPDRIWDVVIVGAGPAGAIAAYHLASRHYNVLLLDRKKFPREKACGDGLLPDALRCLDAIGLGEKIRAAGHPVDTSVLVSPSLNEVDIPGEYLTIKRSLLDMIVVQKAVESEAFFAHGAVEKLWVDSDRRVSLTIQGSDKRIRAPIGILATGADIRLLHPMNWSVQKRPSAVAMRCYVRSTVTLDRLIVSFDQSILPGYAWIFPLKENEYNVGCGISLRYTQKTGINLRKAYYHFLDAFPLANELMRQSDRSTDLQAAALRYDFEGAYPFVNGPIIAVGETIGTTLPFIGEGTGKAMETGKLAADIISKAINSGDLGTLSQYGQQIESEFKARYDGYRIAERWLSRPWLNNFILGRFGSSKYAQEVLAGVIAETKSPQEIFSLKGVLKTFYK